MFANDSDEVCRLCYHLSSTFTERVGRITASDQTVRAVHSCISWFTLLTFRDCLLGACPTMNSEKFIVILLRRCAFISRIEQNRIW